VESHPDAANACRENLTRRGLRDVKVIQQDVASLTLREKVDVIVLDPPRGGAKPLAALVARTQATRVVYVSCHMTTLARDLTALAQLGFRADRACALDMFPQTSHVEAVIRLRRAP
jgi:23S rRNA (uracil1939-C5)-methyltransferase